VIGVSSDFVLLCVSPDEVEGVEYITKKYVVRYLSGYIPKKRRRQLVSVPMRDELFFIHVSSKGKRAVLWTGPGRPGYKSILGFFGLGPRKIKKLSKEELTRIVKGVARKHGGLCFFVRKSCVSYDDDMGCLFIMIFDVTTPQKNR